MIAPTNSGDDKDEPPRSVEAALDDELEFAELAVGSEEGDNVEVTNRELIASTTSVEAGAGDTFVACRDASSVEAEGVEGVDNEVDEGDANSVVDEGVAGVAEDEGANESLGLGVVEDDVEATGPMKVEDIESGNVFRVPTVIVGRIVVELDCGGDKVDREGMAEEGKGESKDPSMLVILETSLVEFMAQSKIGSEPEEWRPRRLSERFRGQGDITGLDWNVSRGLGRRGLVHY